jgi:CRP/FNR family cyclic AMP-dependent transcriptional regulator
MTGPHRERAVPLRRTTLLSPPPGRMVTPLNLLERLGAETRAAVLRLGRKRGYRAGEVVFRQGDSHDGIHLIEAGVIKSSYESADGRELTLGFWTEGHYVGAPQMFGGGQHAWTSTAVSKSSCLWLPGAELREVAHRHGDLAIALIDALVHKSQCYCALLQLLATQSMRVRLARLLAMLCAGEPAGSVELSHAQLASMIGSTRQWVSISLARFENEGLVVRRERGGYSVPDPALLMASR